MAGSNGHVVTAPMITVTDVGGRIHYLQQGQSVLVEASAEELKRLRGKGLIAKAKAAPDPAPEPETLPAEREARPVWEAYAAKVGVDASLHGTKGELVKAVTDAHEAKAAALAGGDAGDPPA
jgi:hypothetical protein